MNYFLIANNKRLSEETINKLYLNNNRDIIVVFNFLLPFKFPTIKNYPNKICVSRRNIVSERRASTIDSSVKDFYSNMSYLKTNQHLFQKIYFVPCPIDMGSDCQSYIDNINFFQYDKSKIDYISHKRQDINKRLGYPGTGIKSEVSTGILYFDFLQKTKDINDQIILVAFTSELSQYHEKDWEKEYFLNKVQKKECYAIDSYNVTNFF